MKTYETWEVIKALSENPKLKFKTDSQGYGYGHEVCLWIDKGGNLVADEVIKQDHPTTCERWLKATWQLVRTPVTWQEAIQAWAAEDKGIECECKSCGVGHADSCKFNSRNDNYYFCKQGIKSGVWFILDGDADE